MVYKCEDFISELLVFKYKHNATYWVTCFLVPKPLFFFKKCPSNTKPQNVTHAENSNQPHRWSITASHPRWTIAGYIPHHRAWDPSSWILVYNLTSKHLCTSFSPISLLLTSAFLYYIPKIIVNI
jgi:hypothetical protein